MGLVYVAEDVGAREVKGAAVISSSACKLNLVRRFSFVVTLPRARNQPAVVDADHPMRTRHVAMNAMTERSLISQRFKILEQVSAGGMGTVHRALDVQTNQLVALKLLNTDQPDQVEMGRFAQEAEVLASLRHPGIVGYVGHGVMPTGQPFLAMEWLEGEDLAHCLRRGPLPVADAVTLLMRVGSALDAAHQAGIVHRDLKPSNLFLREGQCGRVAIIDFGIARYAAVTRCMTRTGSIIGTPDYMAPEQARGERDLGPGADIFSLGCVAYECLVGEPPFAAMHVAATLAKILFMEPEPLSHRSTGIPPMLEALIMSMLAKEPTKRPPSVANVVERLSTIDKVSKPTIDTVPTHRWRMGLATDEQQLFCVIVVTPHQVLSLAHTLPRDDARADSGEIIVLRRNLADYDAQIEPLADGSFVVSLGRSNTEATEQVARAIQCAQLLRERYPEADIVVATGRGMGHASVPVGEAIDRAGRILREQIDRTERRASEAIILDEVSASLLRGRHRLQKRGHVFELLGESATNDPSRPLLGQPTPCLGRESEFSVLEGTLNACIDESMARAILVTGTPGLGKSRLCHEFLRRLGQRALDLQVWMSTCDPLSTGTSYGPLNRTLRRLCDVHDGDSPDKKRIQLRQRVARHLSSADADHVVEFLGELCGVHFPDEHSSRLHAARQDPRLMSDLVTQALLRFIEEECKRSPLLWIIEDLQWSDASTIKALVHALRQLQDTPLFIVASARPEVLESFPNLSSGYLQILPLRPLGRKASERLVHQFLRNTVDAEVVTHIVERADGNPLWLEELIRTAAEGILNEPPRTIMAILQGRIGQLSPRMRQLLRAASVFGETFWLEGVATLLHWQMDGEFQELVRTLVDRELWTSVPNSRYPRQREMRFRHSLMRDAAYQLLTEEDRALGHRLAGEFLEMQGESEAALLAEHARLGGDLQRAIAHYSRAAEDELSGNDVTAALRHAQAGLSCRPEGAALGLLQAIAAMAHHWGGELPEAREAGLSALRLLPRGSRRWYQAMLAMWLTTTYLGEHDLFDSLRDDFVGVAPEPDAIHTYVEATSFLVVMTSLVGQAAESRMFLDRLLQETATVVTHDDAIRGWVSYAHGVYCHWIESDLWQKMQLACASIDAADCIGDRRLRCLSLTSLGLAQMGLGIYDQGVSTFRRALHEVEQLHGETYLLGSTTAFFAQCLTEQNDPAFLDEAITLANRSLQTVSVTAPAAGIANIALAQAQMARGDLEHAVQFAQVAAKTLRVEPAVFPLACAVLAQVHRATGRIDDARQAIQEGKDVIAKIGGACTDVALLFQAAEFAHHVGDPTTTHEDLRECARRLAKSASRIRDGHIRRSYLLKVPLHARIVDRLSQWLGPDAVTTLLSDPSP